jgi:molecular chaperone HscB
MADQTEQAVPAKCKRCDSPMSQPVVCDFCHSLNPPPAATDYFALLGVPRQFDLDGEELRRRFLALSRHAHPDFHAGETQEVQGLSLRISAAINDAYRTLADLAARAGYLLELLGGQSAVDDKSVPDAFLGTMMMMQEELADAKAARRQDELDRLRGVLQTQRDGLLRRIEGLFREHQDAIACQAVRAEGCDISSVPNYPLHMHPLFREADIYGAGKPTIHYKVLAAGRTPPAQAFAFVKQHWREGDAVCVGVSTKDKSDMIREDIALLFGR